MLAGPEKSPTVRVKVISTHIPKGIALFNGQFSRPVRCPALTADGRHEMLRQQIMGVPCRCADTTAFISRSLRRKSLAPLSVYDDIAADGFKKNTEFPIGLRAGSTL